jgi:hypothetical protein
MEMGSLYIKYRVVHYRGEDTASIIKEINDAFLKIHDKYAINGKVLPLHSDYYNMYDDYLDNCGVEPPTNFFISYSKEILSNF